MQCNYFYDIKIKTNSIKCKHDPINTSMNMSKAHKTTGLYNIILWQTVMLFPCMVLLLSADMLTDESS
jgi:hypothetical protein